MKDSPVLRTGPHEGQPSAASKSAFSAGTLFRAAFLADTGSGDDRNFVVLQLEVSVPS